MRRVIGSLATFAVILLSANCWTIAPKAALRVCADPNNLPFSNREGAGFENRIAALLAVDRHASLEYTWWAQRRGFVRNTLAGGTCDVVIGVPTESDVMATTRPYYRSSYVFVSRSDRGLRLASFDDPRLPTLRIGVQMIGDDAANTPPAHALARRGMTRNVVGYMVYGDYARPNPLSEIISAVDRGEVDTAVVWGPTAGFFTLRSEGRLTLSAVSLDRDSPALPFTFDISMGVRRADVALRDELDDFLVRRHADVSAILDAYGVPRAEVQ